MPTVVLSLIGGAGEQFFNNNGTVLSGGKIYTYAAGTTTPLTTYTSLAGTVANPNPVVLNSAGRVSGQIWLIYGASYKFVIKDSLGNTIDTQDNISGSSAAGGLVTAATIVALKAMTGMTTGTRVLVQDIGFFRYDSTSSTTAVGSLVVTPDAGVGRWFLEVDGEEWRPYFNVKQYGAVGDGLTNDATAIQAAVTAAQLVNGAVYFPTGTYAIESPITLGTSPITIFGDGIASSVIKVTAAGTGAFIFGDSGQNSRFTFRDFQINGNGLAQYGIKSDTINHTLCFRVRVTGTTISAFSFGYGWDNDIVECEASSNTGDGIQLNVNNNNAVNIVNTKVFANTGWGIVSSGGSAINIIGCTIEQNRKGGVYLVKANNCCIIQGCYFEGNGQDGFTFTTPAVTVKADIVANGSASATVMSFAYPTNSLSVIGNYFNNLYCEEAVRLIGVYCAQIYNNHLLSTSTAMNLTAVYCDSTICHAETIDLKSNLNFTAECDAENIVTSRPMQFASWKSDQVNLTNYLTDDFYQYALTASGGGTIARSATKYNGFDVFEITGAASTDLWGVTLDVANYPELAGKLVYMACYASVSATDAGSVIYVNGLPNTSSVNSTTAWRLVQMQVVMPASGTRTFRFRKLSGAAGTVAYFTKPVIALAGAPFRDFYARLTLPAWKKSAVPTTGTWAVGEVVYSSAPTAGGPVGWVCVTAGAPGTWAPFGRADLDGSATWDPGSLADGVGETSAAITVTGAALGDYVVCSAPYDLQGITCNAYVSATNTVKIRLQNETGGTIDLASGTWRVRVSKQ